jgi:pyruvyltransferase
MLWQHQHRYLAVGSILSNASRWAEVWGSGFLYEHEKLTEAPLAIHAVRGPRSRAKLLAQGIDCPEIYGDPALLFPYFYNPAVEKKHPIGLIPHYSDKGHRWFEKQRGLPGVHILDIECGLEKFVREVKSCERIISSSLHGLICADAYGVPNQWVEVSDQVDGGSFKFCDYYESVGRGTPVPVRPAPDTPLKEVMEHFTPGNWKFDSRPLIKACPFMTEEVRSKLLEASETGPKG